MHPLNAFSLWELHLPIFKINRCEIVHSEWFPSLWRQCAADGAPYWGAFNPPAPRCLTPSCQPHFILLPLMLRWCALLLNFSPKLANRQFWGWMPGGGCWNKFHLRQRSHIRTRCTLRKNADDLYDSRKKVENKTHRSFYF